MKFRTLLAGLVMDALAPLSATGFPWVLSSKRTMHKEAIREVGNAIWVKQELKLPVANDTSKILVDRDSGEVLKYRHSGKDTEYPKEEIEIIRSGRAPTSLRSTARPRSSWTRA